MWRVRVTHAAMGLAGLLLACAATGEAACAFCDVIQTSNLLSNAGFEDGEGSSIATNWVIYGDGYREDANAWGFTGAAMRDGAYGLKGFGGAMNCVQTNLPVVGGRSYLASGYFYHSSTEDMISNSAFSTRMFMVIEWFDGAGALIAAAFSANHNGLWPADVWTQITRYATAPTNAVTAAFHVETDSDVGGGSLFADALFFGPAWHPAMGWQGRVLADGDSLDGWSVDTSGGSGGSLSLADGVMEKAVQLNWDIGPGDWVQARYNFPAVMDLSDADLIGVTLRGGGPSEPRNSIVVALADTNNSVYHGGFYTENNSINQLDRWLMNISLPKTLFLHASGPSPIDWSAIDRFVLLVIRPGPGEGGGSGSMRIDHVQCDKAADWPRQAAYETVTEDAVAASNVIGYMMAEQRATGLIVSWKEEGSPNAYLYDQAVALIALTRAGAWSNLVPQDAAAEAAAELAGFLVSTQKPGGTWARCWDPDTGAERIVDSWVGDQAWCAMAMSVYAQKSGDTSVWAAAQASADWLSAQIDGTGRIHDSGEGAVDGWWAMMATRRQDRADLIEGWIDGALWEAGLGYWRGASYDPHIIADCASWFAPFARHPRVNHEERGRQALSLVHRALRATSWDGSLCGISLKGPLTVFNEWSAQYVAAGGESAQEVLDTLLSQQNPDGSMPANPDNAANEALGWATTWSGLAPTAWLYFALTGHPFPSEFRAGFSGRVSYNGPQTGAVFVVADTDAGHRETAMAATGAYSVVDLSADTNYWIAGFVDSNGNGVKDEWEAQREYAGSPLYLSNITGHIDIDLEDPDFDADLMPDHWEFQHFGHRTNCAPGDDADADGSSNFGEYVEDTDPTNAASVFTNVIAATSGTNVCFLLSREGTSSNRLYDAYRATSLVGVVDWVPLGLDVEGTGGALELAVTNEGARAFFRLGVRLP